MFYNGTPLDLTTILSLIFLRITSQAMYIIFSVKFQSDACLKKNRTFFHSAISQEAIQNGARTFLESHLKFDTIFDLR